MKFLRIKKRNRQRSDGREWAEARVVTKSRKYGEVIEERCISVKKPVLITGAHSSGKSYWLDRLRKNAGRVWASTAGAEPVYLAASRPLSAWTDTKELELWWAGREESDDTHWTKLKACARLDMLPIYLSETSAVLFIDDAHSLSGRKLKICQECIRKAKIWVITAADEARMSPGLRYEVLKAEPQIFRLDTEAAYDATPQIMWVLIALCITLGFWELAAVLGGLKALASGQRAARQS